MTDPVKEQLSACLDGELPEAELDLLLKQVSRDRELRASLGRYALISETLRSRAAVVAPADFSKRVAAAIEAEPPLQEGPERATPARKSVQWLRPAAGLAVAAGVAAVAILSLQPPAESPETPYMADATSTAPAGESNAVDAGSYIVPAGTTAGGYVPAARLTNYVVAHSEYSTPLGRRSVLSGVLTEEPDDAGTDDSITEEPQPQDDVSQP
jgi:sigma-E factor negative regulatory protein RseA